MWQNAKTKRIRSPVAPAGIVCRYGGYSELFRTVRWANGLFYPRCGGVDIVRYCRYQGHIRRYTCKGCCRTFNDKTGTILHYRHVRMGDWMLAVWMFLCGPPNGISINYIATSIGNAYGTVYQMYRDIMRKVGELPEGKLSGTGEADEGYTRAGSKGVSLGSNGENRTVPSRRQLPRGPGRGTFEKNTPMVTIHHQRAAEGEPDVAIFEVPRGDGKTLAEMVAGRFEPGSTVITDEHPAYKSLGEMGYGHLVINHNEGEYASGEHNDIHTNNCECRIGLLYMVAEKTPRRKQMASGTVRQVFPVCPQPQALWHQWQVRGCAGRHP